MGIGRFIKDTIDHGRDIVEDLEDQVDHWRHVATREHDRRVKGLAKAKIAIAEAERDTAIVKAESGAAAAEAESRGVARGAVGGYQRAMDENDIFDAGFEGGRRRRESMPNTQGSTLVSESQASTQGPPSSLGSKKYMTERSSTSTRTQSRTSGSSTLQGSKQFISERSGRSRHGPPSAERSSKPLSKHGPDRATSIVKDQFKEESDHTTTASRRTIGDSRAELPATKNSLSGQNSTTASKRTVGDSRAELAATKSSHCGDKEAAPSQSVTSSQSTIRPYVPSTVHPGSSISQVKARPHAPSTAHPSLVSRNTSQEVNHESWKSDSRSAAQQSSSSKTTSGKSKSRSKASVDTGSTAPSTHVAPNSKVQSDTHSTVPSSTAESRSTKTTKPNTSSKITSSRAAVRGLVPSSSAAIYTDHDSSDEETVTAGTYRPIIARRIRQMRRRNRAFRDDEE